MHLQLEVAVVVQIIKRRRKRVSSVSVDHVAEAWKRDQGKRGLAVRKETEIRVRIEKNVIDQVLLAPNQEVEVQIRNKENPKAG